MSKNHDVIKSNLSVKKQGLESMISQLEELSYPDKVPQSQRATRPVLPMSFGGKLNEEQKKQIKEDTTKEVEAASKIKYGQLVAGLNAKTKEVMGKLEESNKALLESKNELQIFQGQFAQTQNELQNIQSGLKATEEQLKLVQQELSLANLTKINQQATVDSLNAELQKTNELRAENTNFRVQISQIHSELSGSKKQHQISSTSAKEKEQALQETINTQMKLFEEERKTYRAEIVQLKNQLVEEQQKNNVQTNELAVLRENKKELTNNMQKLDEEYNLLRKENSRLTQSNIDSGNINLELGASIASKTAEIAKIQKESDDRLETANTLNEMLEIQIPKLAKLVENITKNQTEFVGNVGALLNISESKETAPPTTPKSKSQSTLDLAKEFELPDSVVKLLEGTGNLSPVNVDSLLESNESNVHADKALKPKVLSFSK